MVFISCRRGRHVVPMSGACCTLALALRVPYGDDTWQSLGGFASLMSCKFSKLQKIVTFAYELPFRHTLYTPVSYRQVLKFSFRLSWLIHILLLFYNQLDLHCKRPWNIHSSFIGASFSTFSISMNSYLWGP